MAERCTNELERDVEEQQQDFDNYVKNVASTAGTSADQLATLAQLRDQGVITDEEFQDQKAKALRLWVLGSRGEPLVQRVAHSKYRVRQIAGTHKHR